MTPEADMKSGSIGGTIMLLFASAMASVGVFWLIVVARYEGTDWVSHWAAFRAILPHILVRMLAAGLI